MSKKKILTNKQKTVAVQRKLKKYLLSDLMSLLYDEVDNIINDPKTANELFNEGNNDIFNAVKNKFIKNDLEN